MWGWWIFINLPPFSIVLFSPGPLQRGTPSRDCFFAKSVRLVVKKFARTGQEKLWETGSREGREGEGGEKGGREGRAGGRGIVVYIYIEDGVVLYYTTDILYSILYIR